MTPAPTPLHGGLPELRSKQFVFFAIFGLGFPGGISGPCPPEISKKKLLGELKNSFRAGHQKNGQENGLKPLLGLRFLRYFFQFFWFPISV